MRIRIIPTIVAALVTIAIPLATARASCGSSYCFLDAGSREGLTVKGAFRVDLSYQYVDQSRKRSGTGGIDQVLTPKVDFGSGEIEADHHREIRTLNTLVQLDAAIGITPRLSVFFNLPLVNQRDHEHFDEVATPEEHFSGEDGSNGLGDVRLGVRYGLLVKKKDLLVGGVALKLPTGTYKQRDSEGAINEPSIQPGTGSTDGIGRLRWIHQVSSRKLETFASGAYRFNTENDLDYQFGDEMVVAAGFHHRPGGRWSWSLQLNGRHTERDHFLGRGVPSTGADLINLSPGVRLVTERGTELYGYVQLPVYQDVNEAQLTPRAGLVLGVAKTF